MAGQASRKNPETRTQRTARRTCLLTATAWWLTAAGCFSASQMAALQVPANFAKSPSLDSKQVWRVAVLPPAEQADVTEPASSALYDYAGMVLMRTGRFSLVDRSAVDKLLAEQQFSYTGVVDPGTAARLGKLLGAEAVMIINITKVRHDPFWDDSPEQRDAELQVKIVSVETGEVLYSAVGQGSNFEGAAGALRMALETALYPLSRK